MTLVGRAQLNHPSLGSAGGSALHASIESIYTNISDDMAGRYGTYSGVANSTLTTFTHGFGVPFADMKVYIYTGTYPALTRVADPAASGWTIVATSGFLQQKIDVTTPSSGGPFTFAIFVMNGRGAEKLKDLDDINFSTAPIDGQFLIYDSGTSKWLPAYLKYKSEVATVTSNTITPATGANIQRVTTGSADLQMVASPVNGKVYIIINETGSSFQIKNDTGATAANRIYTGTGADFTLKNQASVTLIYNSGLSRWVLAGGGGGGGLAPLPASATITTAVAGTHYLTDTSSAAFSATLPAGIAGSVIAFSDANETWSTNNLTIAPATGEKIDNLATNETLVCDVQRGWVELSWNSVLASWSIKSISAVQYNAQTGSYKAVTSAYSITLADYFISASGASNYAITLPSASSAGSGRIFVIKSLMNTGILLNISTVSSQTIDGVNPGVTPRTIARFESLQLMSNGSNWEIF